MKTWVRYLLLGTFTLGACQTRPGIKENLTVWVDPLIGSGALDSLSLPSNTFPGASVPFGMVQLSPDTQKDIYSTCSGYQWKDSVIYGFSHTHLSGTGISDLFDVLLLPFSDRKNSVVERLASGEPGRLYSTFSHERETASPGYYQVLLDQYQVNAELTCTKNVGVHRYHYPADSVPLLLIDLDHSLSKQRGWLPFKLIDAQLRVVDPSTIEGYRIVTGWARLRKIYFTMKFSRPLADSWLFRGERYYPMTDVVCGLDNKSPKAVLSFDKSEASLEVRVAISAVSTRNARENMEVQTQNKDFECIRQEASSLWEDELSKITVKGSDIYKKMFYSAIYRNYLHPNDMADANGDILLPDFTEDNVGEGRSYYSNFSLWDTYRATHPLLLLTQQKRLVPILNSLIRQGEVYGYLPVWGLWGVDNYCMIGNHAVSVIAEAYVKGLKGVDWERAYDIVKKTLTRDHANTSFFSQVEEYGFYPHDKGHEAASVHLENSYNDWCASVMAHKMGKIEETEFFRNRSMSYKNIYDPLTGFFRPRNSDGSWVEPFDPFRYDGDGKRKYYCEANAWQYLFSVQHDIDGLMALMNGKEGMEKRLDELFSTATPAGLINENASGFIGQYAHGNEPSHHNAYLYNYVGKPWKTQKLVRQIIKEQYDDSHAGISGNDDMGQTSAWLAFSMMGFYPVNPASGIYALGSPVLDEVTICLEGGRQFRVVAHNQSDRNIYVESVSYNGEKLTKPFITHDRILAGGILEFKMTDVHPY